MYSKFGTAMLNNGFDPEKLSLSSETSISTTLLSIFGSDVTLSVLRPREVNLPSVHLPPKTDSPSLFRVHFGLPSHRVLLLLSLLQVPFPMSQEKGSAVNVCWGHNYISQSHSFTF